MGTSPHKFHLNQGEIMKKLVIATLLAATSSIASAQSVEVSGFIREFITDTKTGTAASVRGLTNEAPSHIMFKGSEDLGGGLKARFAVQTSVVTDSPTTGADTQLGNLQSIVGFANQYGSIDMGRQKHSVRLAYDAIDPFLFGVFSPIAKVHNPQGSRLNNAVYTQANVGPLTLKYDHGFSEVAGTGANQSASVSAKVLGVTATVAHFKDDASAQNKSTVGSLDYTVPTLNTRLVGAVSKDETTTTSADAWSVAAVQPVGKIDLKASYGEKNLGGYKAYSVGANYNFSKRTSVEVAYMKVTADSEANESRVAGIGVNHKF